MKGTILRAAARLCHPLEARLQVEHAHISFVSPVLSRCDCGHVCCVIFVPAVSGQIVAVCVKHDASRALQLIVKLGTVEQRMLICTELKGHYFEIVTNHYAHYLMLKLLQY